MVEKILNNTTPYGKIRASHEGSLHSSTLKRGSLPYISHRLKDSHVKTLYMKFAVELCIIIEIYMFQNI